MKSELQIASAKYNLTLAYIRFASTYSGPVLAGKKIFIQNFNSGVILPELFNLIGNISFGTIERWKKSLEDNNFNIDALMNKKEKTGTTVTPQESAILLRALLSPNRPPIQEAIRHAIAIMQFENIIPKSERTYYRYINAWKSKNYDVWVMHREGGKALNDKVMPYISRDLDQIEVGDIIFADGHTLNFEIINPVTGKPKRMTIVLFFDMKSSMPLGFEIMASENIMCIASALRRSILMLGFTPRIVYLDNGRAFKAKYFTSLTSFDTSILPGLFSRLNIQTIFAQPYHGQSKSIEPFFRTFAELERMMPTYTGTSIEDKPARLHRNEKLHKSIYSRMVDESAVTVDKVIQFALNWFLTYAQRPHQDGFYKGYSPEQIYTRSVNHLKETGALQGRIVSKDQLSYLMLSAEARRTGRNGIRFNNSYYWNEQLFGYNDDVIIKYDIFERDEIFVFDKNENYICTAQRASLHHPAAGILGAPADLIALQAQIRTKQNLQSAVNRQFKEYNQTPAHNPFLQFISTDQARSLSRESFSQHPTHTSEAQSQPSLKDNSILSAYSSLLSKQTANDDYDNNSTFWHSLGDDAAPEDYKLKTN